MDFKFCTGLPQSIPWGQFFCFLKFTPTFRVMVFPKFQTVEYDHQHTHYFGKWLDTFLVLRLNSNLILHFLRTIFFFILKFPPIFWVMEFSKFRTVEWDHQQTHHFGQWSDTFLVILLTSNLVHSICKAFPADLFLNFDFLKVLEFWNLATLNSDPKLDKKKPNPI